MTEKNERKDLPRPLKRRGETSGVMIKKQNQPRDNLVCSANLYPFGTLLGRGTVCVCVVIIMRTDGNSIRITLDYELELWIIVVIIIMTY